MEINRYMQEYRKHNPKDFYNWLSQGRIMEIRFLSDYKGDKFKNWGLIKIVAAFTKAEYRFNSIYINSYEQLKSILLYQLKFINGNWPLTRLYNIFISANPKRKVFVKSKSGLLYKSYYGGIAGTSYIQNILCDIEHKEKPKGSTTEAMLEECICGAKFIAKQLDLQSYYINISGNGTHLWFNLEKPIKLPEVTFTEYEDKLKYHLKEDPIYTLIKTYNKFIEKLNRMLQKYNSQLMVDEGAKDISRIARPTGSWNIKLGKTSRAVGTVIKFNINNNIINHKFMAAKPLNNRKSQGVLRKASLTQHNRYNYLNLRESAVYKLMVSQYLPSIVSRNHHLEQSFARLIRDNNIDIADIQDIIQEIDIVQRKSIQVDPEYLDDDKIFNSEMINTYCIASKIDLVYPLLEGVPKIKEDYIDVDHYSQLDSYSQNTLFTLYLPNLSKPNNYLQLKALIRTLVDANHSRSLIFFTMKILFWEDWEYYNKNRIIQQLLNKCRRRKNE